MDPSDQKLIRDYLTRGSEASFEAIVERYAPLVHGAALRITRQPDLAQDVAQMAFAIFTRKASTLSKHPNLAAWLQKTATLEAYKLMKKERALQAKQRAYADETREVCDPGDYDYLDEALATLSSSDRQFLLFRDHQGYQVQEIASLIGKTQSAARKQSERALDRLSKALRKRGVTASSAAIAVLLSSTLVKTTQAGLVPAIVNNASSTAASVSYTALAINTLQTMTTTKQLSLTAAAVAVLAAIPIGLQSQRIGKLERQVEEQRVSVPDETKQLLPDRRSVPIEAPSLSEALEIAVAPLREATLVEMGYRTAERSLSEAIAALESLEKAPDRREFIKGVFSYAANHTQTNEVLELADSFDDKDRETALLATVSAWTSGRAVENGSADRFVKQYGLEAGLGMALVIDEDFRPELGEAWANTYADADGSAGMIGAFATTHLPDDPNAAFAMGDDLTGFDREMFLHVVVDNWAQKDPSAAWDWVQDNQGIINSHSGRIITEVVADLTRSDLSQAEAAMETLTRPEHRQFAIVGMARALSFHQGTEAAVTWANTLPTETEKDTAHEMIAQIAPKGIGTVLAIESGFPKVTGLVDHGAAARDGRIEVGDRIVAVESGQGHFELLYGQPMQRALDLLRGEAGSTVKLRLVRNDADGNAVDQLVELERQQIVLPKHKELLTAD